MAAISMQDSDERERRKEIHMVEEGLELGGNPTSTVDVEPRTGSVEMSMAETKKTKKTNKAEEETMEKSKAVMSFWRLFQCADSFDYLLMILGTLGAIVNGLTLPVMLIIQGRLINTFGTLQNDPSQIYDGIKKVGVAGPGTLQLHFVNLVRLMNIVFFWWRISLRIFFLRMTDQCLWCWRCAVFFVFRVHGGGGMVDCLPW